MLIGQKVVELAIVANCPMRAPGESIGTFALESAIDELADAMAIDPIALRRRIEPEQDPTSGLPFSSRHLTEAYQQCAPKTAEVDRSLLLRAEEIAKRARLRSRPGRRRQSW
jgi:xanthine dehydrogenase YagR molybdenum-binding subunit